MLIIENNRFIIGSITADVDSEETAICLLQDTIIRTDQGYIKIQNIRDTHTIDNHKCIGLSYGYFSGDTIVRIPKNSLGIIFLTKTLM